MMDARGIIWTNGLSISEQDNILYFEEDAEYDLPELRMKT
jgi:hypothetical protein